MSNVYVPLHQHSFYSHDGGCFVDEIAQFCADHSFPACALTDHARVDGMVKFAKACYDRYIKPLIGVEAYFQPILEAVKGAAYYHFGFIAKNQLGYENLMQMLSEAAEKYFYGRANVTYELLEKYHEGIIVLSGCISSYPAKKYIAGDVDEAFAHIQRMKQLCGENYYIELQPFPVYLEESKYPQWANQDVQRAYNEWLIAVSEQLHIQVVLTADSHYVDQAKLDTHMMAQRLRHKPDMLADYSMRYMHTYESMLQAWITQMGDYYESVGVEALQTTVEIADGCEELLKAPFAVDMPALDWVGNADEQNQRFLEAVREALVKKGKQKDRWYYDQAQLEINKIVSKGFAGYFLMIDDFVRWCKSQNILVHARGSVCGSLVAYLLDFHTIDPKRWPIVSFPRFMGDRDDLPDVDLDIPGDYEPGRGPRTDALKYISERYNGNTALISTYGRWTTKNLLAAMIKATGIPEQDASMIKTSLEAYEFSDANPPDYEKLMKTNSFLMGFDRQHAGFVRIFCQLYGSVNFVGTHPAGVIVASPNIRKRVAINRVNGKLQTACDMDDAPWLGLVKLDVLGVDNLSVIQFAEQDAGVTFTEDIYWDESVLRSFGRGQTLGIFQFSRRKAQQMCREASPILSPMDIATLTACNRPEPIKEGSYQEWIAKRKQPWVSSGLPWDDEFTRGAWIFQEQVMAVCFYAGLSQKQVDKVLKMLKRYRENNQELEDLFVAGMKNKGWDEARARDLWQTMRRYLFNAAHAASYAAHAMRQKYLKEKHKHSWYLALMRFEEDKLKRMMYQREAIGRGVYFAPPHINGGINFERIMIGDTSFIQYGLCSIHGLGDKGAFAILQERQKNGPYKSTDDFVERLSVKYSKVNAAARSAVIEAGAAEYDPELLRDHILLLNKLKG